MSDIRIKSWEELAVDPCESPSLPSPSDQVLEDIQQTILQNTQFIYEDSDIAATQVYDEGTASTIIEEAIRVAGFSGRIALLYCPLLYRSLRESHPARTMDILFEFDPRFKSLGNTIILPLNDVKHVPRELSHSFDVIIADLTQPEGVAYIEALVLAQLLNRLHEPLRLIVLAPADGTVVDAGMSKSRLKPHCKGRADIVVFSSTGHFRL